MMQTNFDQLPHYAKLLSYLLKSRRILESSFTRRAPGRMSSCLVMPSEMRLISSVPACNRLPKSRELKADWKLSVAFLGHQLSTICTYIPVLEGKVHT